MRVERIFDPEAREEFDEDLFEPFAVQKRRTPEEAYELAMARYEMGLGPPPKPVTVIGEGEVIKLGSDR